MSALHILASLPHVPHFARLARLPVGPAVHAARLAGLGTAEQAALAEMRARAWPERGAVPAGVALPAAVAAWCRAVEHQRLGLAALRVAAGRAAWSGGAAPKRQARLPAAMAADAAALLAADDMRGLEQLRLEAMWTAAGRQLALLGPGLAALLLTVARYDIAEAWLAGDAGLAPARLLALAEGLVVAAHG